MNNPNTELKKSLIVIIQSLKDDEKLTGEILYKELLQYSSLRNRDTDCNFYNVKNKKEFIDTLNDIRMNLEDGDILTIHIEYHGDEEGIYLSSREIVSWEEFENLIRPINIKTCNLLFVVLAMCLSVSKISCINPKMRAPYNAFLYTTGNLTPNLILRCFEAFYQEYNSVLDINRSLRALRAEEGVTDEESKFKVLTAEDIFNITFDPNRDISEVVIFQLLREHKEINARNIEKKTKKIQAIMKITHDTYYDYYNFKDIYE